MKRVLSFAWLVCAVGLAAGCQQKGGPVSVTRVEPDQGLTAGGDQVVIHGGGFEPGKTQVEVRFGRAHVDQVSIASSDKIVVVTPPNEKGPVDVTLMFNDGAQFKIPGGFHYVPVGGGDDVRQAFFGGKQGEHKAGSTTTNTTPPPAPKP